MKVRMKTGQAIKKSGAHGKEPKFYVHDVEILSDNSERRKFDAGKYLPHCGEKQKAKNLARMKR